MRVLSVGNMYPPHHLGGYELVWRDTVEHLRTRDHHVRVLATDLRLEGEHAQDPEYVRRDLRWYWHDHRWPRRGLRERLAIERLNARMLEREITRHRPDVVTWWSMGGLSLSLLGRAHARGVPSAALVLDDWLLYAPHEDQWLRTFTRHPRARTVGTLLAGRRPGLEVEAVDDWLFLSDFTRRRALESGWELNRTQIAHLGVDGAQFAAHPAASWEHRVLFVGRIEPRKGVDAVIGALPELPQATLEVVGHAEPSHRTELDELATSLGVRDRVRFAGARTRAELPAVYAGADVVVFPSRWEEPWGLVPLEAMAVGRPVVATARGGSAEYLRDGENALVVERDDPGAIARAVLRLEGDRALRERLVGGGLQTAGRHTAAAYYAQVEHVLAELVGAQPPSRHDA